MKISQIISILEDFAPLPLQEEFDNSGLQIGDSSQILTGVLLCLDVTEDVIDEALEMECNLIISHHPLLFKPLKSITGRNYIERCAIKACKHDLVIYAAHTNLDNVSGGVSFRIAEKIGLQNIRVLSPKNENDWESAGSGVVGELLSPEDESSFLLRLKQIFQLDVLKHSPLRNTEIREVAICGGSGAFLIPEAINYGADIFITGEAKYNDYYDVEKQILLAVIGHYESEICTKELFFDIITKKIPNFALHFSTVNTNPVKYI